MFYQLKSYILFLIKSTNQHGVHSPFLYDLVTNCFYDRTKHPEYSILSDFRKKRLQSSQVIEVTDFGQGSRVFKSNSRKVSQIAKYVGISQKRQRLLFRLARYLKPELILELGTSLGMSTAAMALGNPTSKVISLEGCTNTAMVARENFNAIPLKQIELYTQTFETYFEENPSKKYDLIFVDGNHNKESTLRYFELLLKNTTSDSVLIFDDIYWSPQMTEAWEEIRQHPKVTVSVDTFQWGVIFFRTEQQKEHFTIRL